MAKLNQENRAPFNPDMMVLLKLSANWRKPCLVLDGGCGNAETSRWLARSGCDVIGVDINLPYAERMVNIEGVVPGTLRLIKGDLRTIDFNNQFHVVALFGVLHYLGSPQKVEALLQRLDSWLADDGLAVLTWITDEIAHEDPSVYLPSKSSVVKVMNGIGYCALQFWDKFIEHAHGGDRHRHCIAYSAWTRKDVIA